MFSQLITKMVLSLSKTGGSIVTPNLLHTRSTIWKCICAHVYANHRPIFFLEGGGGGGGGGKVRSLLESRGFTALFFLIFKLLLAVETANI